MAKTVTEHRFYVERYVKHRDSWRVVLRIKPYATMEEAKAKVDRLMNTTGNMVTYRAVELEYKPIRARREWMGWKNR